MVLARHLPYGVWWDRLRPSVQLVRDGEPSVEPLPLNGVWVDPTTFVPLDDPRYEDSAAPYRAGCGSA